MEIHNKVAIVTGGSKGIGKDIAICLAKEGAKVVICSRNEAELTATTKLINDNFGLAVGIRTDVSNENDLDKLVDMTMNSFGRIDFLINNASVAGSSKPLENCTLEEWMEVMNINLNSVFLLSKKVIPIMKVQKFGRIINISSGAGIHPIQNIGPYGVAKAGVIMMTRQFSSEVGKNNITVNCIAPGLVLTEMVMKNTEKLAKQVGVTTEQFINSFEEANHLNHIGRATEPNEVANTTLYLCSSESSALTGEVISLAGGWMAG